MTLFSSFVSLRSAVSSGTWIFFILSVVCFCSNIRWHCWYLKPSSSIDMCSSCSGTIGVSGQNLEPYAKEIGATFCKYLAFRNNLPRKYFSECGEPSCNWDDWQDALQQRVRPKKQRVVLSYGHNGFGNQLWEHSVAFMIAEALHARLLVAVVPDEMSPGGFIPPNTWSGMQAMERMLPDEFLFENLPAEDPIRALCDSEDFYLADRPVDFRNKNYSTNFRQSVHNLISDSRPRCVKLLGYFQNLPLCAGDLKRLWTERLLGNVTQRPGEHDISIYLRCLPRHYHFNGARWYENILENSYFENVWLFQAPTCPSKLGDDPAKDGVVAAVIRLLKERYHAKVWPQLEGTDETAILLHDLAGLALSKKLILPISSWAFWAGLLSNASEVHVNAPPMHQVMYGLQDKYIYHHEKDGEYFGRLNQKQDDIVYDSKDFALAKRMKQKQHAEALRGRGIDPATAAATATAGKESEPPAAVGDKLEKIVVEIRLGAAAIDATVSVTAAGAAEDSESLQALSSSLKQRIVSDIQNLQK